MASRLETTLTLRTSFPCTGADLVAARACEETVFGRRFGNTPAELADEYGPYEDSTDFGGVFLPDGTAVGEVRLIRDGVAGLKSLNDASAAPWALPLAASCRAAGIDPASTWDVGSFAVDAERAGSGRQVTQALWSVLFGALRDNLVRTFVAILDSGARRPIDAMGVEMLDLPGAAPAAYLGSTNSVPVYRHVGDLHRMHHHRFAELHQQVFHGRGVEGLDPRCGQLGAFELAAA
jgi:hypothetical protein